MTNEQEWVTGEVTLNIDGEPLRMSMTVPAKPVTPRRMLPIFQQMTNAFTDRAVQAAVSQGDEISCKAGCGACCRQAVPLAEIETYALAAIVDEMPEPRRTQIREKFEKASAHFSSIGWLQKLESCVGKPIAEINEVVMEYFREGIECPFLEEGSCSIHPVRPLACREYLVTSPAENCASPTKETIRMLRLDASPAKTVRLVGRENVSGVNFIPLVFALRWAEATKEDYEEKTGEAWMADFFRILTSSSPAA
jgi:Fe-S-cluster containining protein